METKTEVKPKDEKFCHHPLTLLLRPMLFLSCYQPTVNTVFDRHRFLTLSRKTQKNGGGHHFSSERGQSVFCGSVWRGLVDPNVAGLM